MAEDANRRRRIALYREYLQIGIDGDLARPSLDEITRAERARSELRAEATGACALSILSRVRMNSE
jgi:hypothetical protein